MSKILIHSDNSSRHRLLTDLFFLNKQSQGAIAYYLVCYSQPACNNSDNQWLVCSRRHSRSYLLLCPALDFNSDRTSTNSAAHYLPRYISGPSRPEIISSPARLPDYWSALEITVTAMTARTRTEQEMSRDLSLRFSLGSH